ncbi:MAG: hypothetical protein K0R50_1266 [Eubacterium sp.]|jgi:hypothetical protein|nr:hypothetical protein [Eubacterium sp.]
MADFEKEVRKKLIDLEMSIPELCKSIGISTPYLYDVFKGNRKAKELKGKVCAYLNLPPSLISK